MNSMFEGCKSLKSIDIPNMNLSKVNNIAYLFKGWESFRSNLIEKRNWNEKYNIYIILENKPIILVFTQISLKNNLLKKIKKNL